jgi:ATP-dependent DNA helicase PIF1
LEIRLITGQHAGETVFIPRIGISPAEPQIPFKFCCRQFPVRLCFAMTINKSQGQSLAHIGLDLRNSVFTHGQFYVAVSQVTSVLRLKAKDMPRGRLHMGPPYLELFEGLGKMWPP